MVFKIFRYVMSLILVLVVTGCDQSNTDKTVLQEIGLRPVSIQLQWMTQAQFAGYYVALEKGWYRQEGLDVTIYPGGPDIAALDLVVSGARDFGTTLLADLVVSIGKGKPVVSIAQLQQDNGLRLICKNEIGIRQPKDFVGKKVGVWLGGWEVQFNALLSHQGIHPDQVEIVSQGFSMRPLLDGRLDVASAMIYNEYFMVLASGLSSEDIHIINYADFDLDFPGDVLFTTNKVKDNDPELCMKMLRASLRGWQYAISHIDEAVEIVLKYDTALVATKDHQKKMMNQISKLMKGSGDNRLGIMNADSFNQMINLLVKYQMLDSPLAVSDVYTSEFVEQIDE